MIGQRNHLSLSISSSSCRTQSKVEYALSELADMNKRKKMHARGFAEQARNSNVILRSSFLNLSLSGFLLGIYSNMYSLYARCHSETTVHDEHLREGLPSYHADEYFVHPNYPEITKSFARL
ncbi:hypothetical protein BJ878DRAFT_476184 [Calycina marina]|uniref:Uncharacterized protein n=1 Tax=Calycina marina TaxID=1763456 RepID=A0A9P7ZB38_9HELO|nr:hypothetical protein BJ878DRAFT_476184 [Calycina marina]